MKFLLHMLLVLTLAFSGYAAAAPSQSCCGDDECGIIQCSQMGCVPAGAAIATADVASVRVTRTAQDYAPAIARPLPATYEELWTPPD
ncbi:MAG: hypothetical protein V4484_03560 [Pseudomonadota bacterium]